MCGNVNRAATSIAPQRQSRRNVSRVELSFEQHCRSISIVKPEPVNHALMTAKNS
jgi:hypothetical protein